MATYLSVNTYAEFAYEETLRLAGGADEYSVHTLSAIWAECQNNKHLMSLAGAYLVGSSASAERSLARLQAELRRVFGLEN